MRKLSPQTSFFIFAMQQPLHRRFQDHMLNPAQTHQALCFASAETVEQTHNFSEPENNPLLLLSLHKQLSKQLRWDLK